MDNDRIEKLAEAYEGGEAIYECSECGELVLESDVQNDIRECPHCDEKFSAEEEGGRNCPQCNRPFTRKICATGCPDCFGEVSEYRMSEDEEKAVVAYINTSDE